MRKILLVLAMLLVGCVGGYAVYDRQQSIARIDKSLHALEAILEEAETDSEQYAGGLIKSLVTTRIETIQTTMAMLTQKRSSLLHRIDLHYSVAGRPYSSLTDEQQRTLQSDIEDVKTKISDARKEAKRYRGGLVKVLILSRLETEQLTLAGLRQRHLLDKHRIPWRLETSKQISQPSEHPVVPDDQAL